MACVACNKTAEVVGPDVGGSRRRRRAKRGVIREHRAGSGHAGGYVCMGLGGLGLGTWDVGIGCVNVVMLGALVRCCPVCSETWALLYGLCTNMSLCLPFLCLCAGDLHNRNTCERLAGLAGNTRVQASRKYRLKSQKGKRTSAKKKKKKKNGRKKTDGEGSERPKRGEAGKTKRPSKGIKKTNANQPWQ